MNFKILLALLLTLSVILLGHSSSLAQEPDARVEELFSMAEKLEKLKPLTLTGIEKTTGHRLHWHSVASYASDLQSGPNILLGDVEVLHDREGNITSVRLGLPRQGLGITLTEVQKRYGRWNNKNRKKIFDEDSMRRFGYRTLIAYEYKRLSGWLSFQFDDDQDKQLRILDVTR